MKTLQRQLEQKQKYLDKFTEQLTKEEFKLKSQLDEVLREWQDKCDDLNE